MSYWRNKVAVVTGGSSGLGRAIVAALAAGEAKVVAVARGEQRLAELCRPLAAAGANIIGAAADITQQGDVDRVVLETVKIFGGVDILVNCAGRSTRAGILETTPDEMQAMWEVNVLATVRMTLAAAPHVIAARGHIVNIGSLASKTASPFLGAYPATKHALAAYTQQLRLELGPAGVHVLFVCPGPIAREGSEPRYAASSQVPPEAQRPGGGAKVRPLDPSRLAAEILRACEGRRPELVRPRRARLLFAAAAMSPRLGDWLVRKFTKAGE